MLRFLRYLAYVMISRKAIQSARSVFGERGLAVHVFDAASYNLKLKIRSAVAGMMSAALTGIGAIYLLFHTAAEYDQNGYIVFNAQKSVCLVFIFIGLGLILFFARGGTTLKPLKQAPTSEIPIDRSERAKQLHNLFQMVNTEAAKFLEQTTRPNQNSSEARPPMNERALV